VSIGAVQGRHQNIPNAARLEIDPYSSMYIDGKRAVTIGGFRQADGSQAFILSSEQIPIHFFYRDMSLFNPREPM
jgi:hypothetical protein